MVGTGPKETQMFWRKSNQRVVIVTVFDRVWGVFSSELKAMDAVSELAHRFPVPSFSVVITHYEVDHRLKGIRYLTDDPAPKEEKARPVEVNVFAKPPAIWGNITGFELWGTVMTGLMVLWGWHVVSEKVWRYYDDKYATRS